MTLFESMSDYVGDRLFTSFFGIDSMGASMMFVVFLYGLVIAVGLKTKMSLDAMVLSIGLTTAVGGAFLSQTAPLFALFMIVVGIIVSIGFMYLWRR